MARWHLSAELKTAGRQLLATTDALGLQAQGAMWIYDHALEDWRYYLVTSLVDTIGRRKTYQLLLDAFEHSVLPPEMTIEDVHLGSPQDNVFTIISAGFHVGSEGFIDISDCAINGMLFDGCIYRLVREVPTRKQAESIEKRFVKRVKDLAAV